MSINDLLDSEEVIPMLLVMLIIGAIVAIPTFISMINKSNNNIYGDNEYGEIKEEINTKIISKRTNPHPVIQNATYNTVVFELSSGVRIELAIKDPNTYGNMVEGDCGTLKYQGKKFVSFERNA